MADYNNPFADPSVTGAAQPSSSSDTPSWLAPEPPGPSSSEGRTGSNQPPWLSDPVPPTQSGPPGSEFSSTPPPASGSSQPLMDISWGKLPREIVLMRIANLCSAFLLACLAALKLQKNTGDVSSGVISFYLFAFAILIFTFECHVSFLGKVIADNLGFMYQAPGRASFMILLGMLCFSDEPLPGFGYFVGIFVIVTALLNAFIMFKVGCCYFFFKSKCFVQFPNYERSCRINDLGE